MQNTKYTSLEISNLPLEDERGRKNMPDVATTTIGYLLTKLGIVSFIPFLAITKNGEHKVNYTRIIEALIIAAITAGFIKYTDFVEMKTELAIIKTEISKTNENVSKLNDLILNHITTEPYLTGKGK